MNKHLIFAAAGLVITSGVLSAQSLERRASMTNHASGDREKCTVEVRVDGAAEVEIRGDSAFLRNLSGAPPQWRRFECSAPLPRNPVNFRFSGVDGRGRQQLIRDPRDGGPAVVRIEDPDNGSEGYTFDITWGGGAPGYSEGRPPAVPVPPPPQYGDRRFTTEQAVDVCRDAIRQQAVQRFRTNDIRFRRINIDDNPGRNDWVVGVLDVRRDFGREEPYRFSCSVNFDNGRVRSAEIQPFDERGYSDERGGFGGGSQTPGINACQRAVEDRLRGDGYDRVNFRSINVDDRPGGSDRVVGFAEANGRYGRADGFDFSCSVRLETGEIRGVDVRRR
jgi:hypothetical protein